MDRGLLRLGLGLWPYPISSMELTFRQMSLGTVYCCVSDSHPTLFPTYMKAASQQRFAVEHAMMCKNGGLILLCHNDLSLEWQELCAQHQALSTSAVSDKPLIHNSQGQQEGGAGVRRMEPLPDIWGDVSAHGF
eukprot:scaffold15216_cov41-Attheya_sp.AAC.1